MKYCHNHLHYFMQGTNTHECIILLLSKYLLTMVKFDFFFQVNLDFGLEVWLVSSFLKKICHSWIYSLSFYTFFMFLNVCGFDMPSHAHRVLIHLLGLVIFRHKFLHKLYGFFFVFWCQFKCGLNPDEWMNMWNSTNLKLYPVNIIRKFA